MNLGNSAYCACFEGWQALLPALKKSGHPRSCWIIISGCYWDAVLTSCGDQIVFEGPNHFNFDFKEWIWTCYCVPFLTRVCVSNQILTLFFQNLVPGERTSLQHNSFVLSPQVTTHDPPLKSAIGSKQSASVNTPPSLSWLSNLTSGNVNKENKGMCRASKE